MANTKTPKQAKTYTIVKHRRGQKSETTGTLTELINHFSYTLASGNSYNHAINTNPKTARGLVSALNKSVDETQRGSFSPNFYSLDS